MIESPLEVLVVVSTPDDYPSWTNQQQRERCKRVLEWHSYVRDLNPSVATQVWGTHQLLSHTHASSLNNMHVLVYRVDTMADFDRLMIEDPLRGCSRYATFALAPLSEDHERDLARFNKIKAELLDGRDEKDLLEYSKLRALFTRAPDFVGKHPPQDPPNKIIDLSAKPVPEEKVDVLVLESNTDANQDFTDAQQLMVYEKVLWWADYASKLITDKVLTHGWTLHNFCNAEAFEGQREGAVALYSCDTWEQFDSLYSLNPVRRAGKFWTIMLQPLHQQFMQDQLRYDVASRR